MGLRPTHRGHGHLDLRVAAASTGSGAVASSGAINAGVKEKTLKEADAVPKANILDFCKEHYEDILLIIMDRAQERLSDTYSPSITKSEPSRARFRDPSHSRGRSLSRDRHRIRDRLRGVEESYDDTYSSHRTGTKYRDRSRDRDHSRSKSRAKRRKPADEADLAVPWTCEDVDPFTPRIRNFKSSRKIRMPNNVKTYDATGDPEDHLKIFQAAAQVERWAMPTWCHMFNSTLIGAARVWFDELPPESIDGYKGLKAAFLTYFMQQKKYVKDPVEIHNIKQRDGETIEEFMEHFKIETGRMKGAP
ncbi:reverse transcriptase domain-containing protein [Tanacetum coccineum]|uniref:Reverse transcriptase domain-containing protein n=1 Tax=Tanacetum coccineum TaxID=301880 RepID=A0ABQ5FG92_9ASTR